VAANLIAGKRIRAYAYFCASCHTQLTVYPMGYNPGDKADKLARKAYWTKKKSGWHCPDCQKEGVKRATA
jgi:ribosomal protein L37AE/L43A